MTTQHYRIFPLDRVESERTRGLFRGIDGIARNDQFLIDEYEHELLKKELFVSAKFSTYFLLLLVQSSD